MNASTGIRQVIGARLYFLPVQTRVPLKFGTETLQSVTCARVAMRVVSDNGREVEGWGETPLSVQWVWPSATPYETRHQGLRSFCLDLAGAWHGFACRGHALEVGHDFLSEALPALLQGFNRTRPQEEPMPWLAALVCNSCFDLALHDAFGKLVDLPVYKTYGPSHLSRDLSCFLEPADSSVSFDGRYPADFLAQQPRQKIPAWHLVGGLDPLEPADLTGSEPNDDHPVLLPDWIHRDGLRCLKIKLCGTDLDWDYDRMVRVGLIALQHGVTALSADFNCTVRDVAYVTGFLERLQRAHPRIYELLLYVEQPFPYELEQHRIEVFSISRRKLLFLDESAHDWRLIRLGRELGWNGVALKTCKTQTNAILSACWATAHGLSLMVQDLTNPMLAQISHLQLAANLETLLGVETNSMQFYPDASAAEAIVHPGLFRRRQGEVALSTIQGPGFGYRLEAIQRPLPSPAWG